MQPGEAPAEGGNVGGDLLGVFIAAQARTIRSASSGVPQRTISGCRSAGRSCRRRPGRSAGRCRRSGCWRCAAFSLRIGRRRTPIIITTIQKFPFIVRAPSTLEGKGAALKIDTAWKRFAVIVDEAHSSHSGEAATALRGMLNRN
jgi:hypothetical protein